jgi:hypothetical protein
MKPVSRAVCIAASLLVGTTLAFPEPAHASFWKKVKKTAKKATKAVTKTANQIVDAVDDIAEVDDIVIDASVSVGKELKKEGSKTIYELKDGGKHIGNLVVENGKVVAMEGYDAAGKLVREVETGPKYLVQGSKIVGQEIIINGKVVGNTIIENGKVVGQAAVAGGEYVVAQGMLVLKAINNAMCKTMVNAVRDAKKIDTNLIPEVATFSNKVLAKAQSVQKAVMPGNAIKTVSSQIDAIGGDIVPEAMRIAEALKTKSTQVAGLFTAANMCDSSSSQLLAKVKELGLQPKLSRFGLASSPGDFFFSSAHAQSKELFVAHTMSLDAAYGPGLSFNLSIVTNYKDKAGSFIAVGPALKTPGAGAAIGIQFYPHATLDNFKGWGHGFGASVDLPIEKLSKNVGKASAGASFGWDFAVSEKFDALQGFGPNLGYGVGHPKFPGSVGYNATYSWKLK